MKLKRPMIFTQIDTTGKNIRNDRIISIGMVKQCPDGTVERFDEMINPTIPITDNSKQFHGIEDSEVKTLPTFSIIADELHSFITGDGICDFAGYSLGFQLKILQREFDRCDHVFVFGDSGVIDAYRMWSIIEPRSLFHAVQVFCERDLPEKRTAIEAAEAVQELIDVQCDDDEFRGSDIKSISNRLFPENVDSEGKFYRNNGIRFGFGSYKGELISDHPDYLKWVLKKEGFPKIVKDYCRKALRGELDEA